MVGWKVACFLLMGVPYRHQTWLKHWELWKKSSWFDGKAPFSELYSEKKGSALYMAKLWDSLIQPDSTFIFIWSRSWWSWHMMLQKVQLPDSTRLSDYHHFKPESGCHESITPFFFEGLPFYTPSSPWLTLVKCQLPHPSSIHVCNLQDLHPRIQQFRANDCGSDKVADRFPGMFSNCKQRFVSLGW